ncbi:MAG: M48 family metallopeptidase [Legionellales bacterium]
MILNIDDIAIEVLHKPIKNINLRIYPPDGLIKVSVPLRYSEQLIRQHLIDKMPWICAQRERIRRNAQPQNQILQSGSAVNFMGHNYILIINEQNGPSHIEINQQIIHCFIQPNASQAQLITLFERWYRREMEALIPDLITHWAAIIGVQVNEWGIKKMKTRWGSCNVRAARIWLNLSLIKKPLSCLEYVLVHELVHLLEASHNARFYALMTQFMPQWREYQSILTAVGH